MEVLLYPKLPRFPKEHCFLEGGVAHLFFWYEQRVDEDEWGASVE